MIYAVSDDFNANACKHCAPMLIIQQRVGMVPTANDPSATLTFIRFRERTFGVTCKHVVESLRNLIKESGNQFSHTFFIALKQHHMVQDRFVFPAGDWNTPRAVSRNDPYNCI